MRRHFRSGICPRILISGRRLAKTEGVQAESLEGIREVYDRALEAGYGDKDYSSVIDMVFEKNHVKYKPKL